MIFAFEFEFFFLADQYFYYIYLAHLNTKIRLRHDPFYHRPIGLATSELHSRRLVSESVASFCVTVIYGNVHFF